MNYYCAKFDTNISGNMDTTSIFPFLSIFAHNFYYLPPPPHQILDLFSFTSSLISLEKAMNYDYAKFHAFIKKLKIGVILGRL